MAQEALTKCKVLIDTIQPTEAMDQHQSITAPTVTMYNYITIYYALLIQL
jgi:hypothetical protein